MRAADIMSTQVITVGPEATVGEVASLMLRHAISAVPVIDKDGAIAGIVSEGDLMRRSEIGTQQQRSWWLRSFGDTRELARDYTKANARLVRDVMTAPVTTVGEGATLAEIAELLEKNRIKRVPVVRDGLIVGIVSRANLLRALAVLAAPPAPVAASDQAIRSALLAELKQQAWGAVGHVNIMVNDGVVTLWGIAQSAEERRARRVAAENTPGVRKVVDNLAVMPIVPGL